MGSTTDAGIAAHARAQHGLLTRSQLLEVGVSARTISRWATSGRLVRAGARVFRVASAPVTPRSVVLAACLDRHAVGSHLTGAWLHGMLPRTRWIDVTVTRGRSRRMAVGDDTLLRVHSSTNLPADDVVVVDGIPITTVARSLLGVAALVPHEVSQDELVDVVAGAIETRAASMAWLRWLLDERRCRGRNGVVALEAALDERARIGPTESWLERRMLSLLSAAGLPRPVLQRSIPRGRGRAARVDFSYERQRIVIEVLGYAFHRTPEQMAADTMRANELQLQGLVVLQLTARTLRLDPGSAVQVVADALIASRPASLHPPVLGPPGATDDR